MRSVGSPQDWAQHIFQLNISNASQAFRLTLVFFHGILLPSTSSLPHVNSANPEEDVELLDHKSQIWTLTGLTRLCHAVEQASLEAVFQGGSSYYIEQFLETLQIFHSSLLAQTHEAHTILKSFCLCASMMAKAISLPADQLTALAKPLGSALSNLASWAQQSFALEEILVDQLFPALESVQQDQESFDQIDQDTKVE